MSVIKFIFLIALTVLLVSFCVANREFVTIDLFPFQYSASVPLFVVVIGCAAVGVVTAAIMFGVQLAKTNCRMKKIGRRIAALEDENKALRSERGLVLFPTSTNK